MAYSKDLSYTFETLINMKQAKKEEKICIELLLKNARFWI